MRLRSSCAARSGMRGRIMGFKSSSAHEVLADGRSGLCRLPPLTLSCPDRRLGALFELADFPALAFLRQMQLDGDRLHSE